MLSDILRKQYFSYQHLGRCLSKLVSHCMTTAPYFLHCNMAFGMLMFSQLNATHYHTGKVLHHSSLKEQLQCGLQYLDVPFKLVDAVVVLSLLEYELKSLPIP